MFCIVAFIVNIEQYSFSVVSNKKFAEIFPFNRFNF